ncbi:MULTISPECIES: TetR/AcrR family transcriptional regulator [unclassified Saccharibacter]|uniref:TetR/AcrR family transcriptional regulator n=1 Tax=unclassified Saccharibacter TaxID=2648722 RepID=UPI00132C1CA2|nr:MULTISPECIES: TetR/AcrR family transcriptional regulator [unclassified Saccharibacter]MXV36527.1 TetR family transcriptional regulator [Saccharibacter sp. EH611]MXV57689.1 TetR family transcriptional regulator [Saccharibacter sp. EH70]MXV65004.1 TetR family transcriptional regulator [Saccharibacter sp. EH60]
MSQTERHLQVKQAILRSARPLIGARGFSAVGLSQILEAAAIPKGSFYHYFSSKEHFGEALLEMYVEEYLQHVEALFRREGGNGYAKMLTYCQWWQETHVNGQIGNKCLIVKLAAEVSDLSERMRAILEVGTSEVIKRLETVISEGQNDGSITQTTSAFVLAATMYQMWLGATLMMKMTHTSQPFDVALSATQSLLQRS